MTMEICCIRNKKTALPLPSEARKLPDYIANLHSTGYCRLFSCGTFIVEVTMDRYYIQNMKTALPLPSKASKLPDYIDNLHSTGQC